MRIDTNGKKNRLIRTLEFLAYCNGKLCPIEDLSVEGKNVPWCSEDFCEHESWNGIECYKRWIMGES